MEGLEKEVFSNRFSDFSLDFPNVCTYDWIVLGELRLLAEALDWEATDPRELAAVIDILQAKLCRRVSAAVRDGEHQLTGKTSVSWVADICQLSKSSAADRLCVGGQIDSLPEVEQALNSGRIGYQAVSVICHLSEQLGDKRDHIEAERWVEYAQRFSLKQLRYLAREARYAWDPEGQSEDAEDDFDLRELHLSETARGMFRLDGWLDPVGGAALKAAIDALSKPLGRDDERTGPQRRADAAVELAHHAMDAGSMPRRNGARPHVAVHTTPEALRGAVGAPVSHLECGMPVSVATVQRLACDGTLHRVLMADSVVTDMGRATRAVSPAQWRALKARHRTCSWPGCDRPIGWTNPHHIEFFGRGGRSDLPNLLPLCFHHHRLVHEGGWQVVKAGSGYDFIPPERLSFRRARGPGGPWAA